MLSVLQSAYITFNLSLLRTANRYPYKTDFGRTSDHKHHECDASESETILLSGEDPAHAVAFVKILVLCR